jgi:two-component system, OmpR family, response regulator MprA
MTVLVVDDEIGITESLCELLADAGHEPVAAGNGQEGLEAFEKKKPDLVVADVMMPKLDGRQMVREIRSRPEGREVPIILMSAARGIADDGGIGHDVFLEKPFDLDEFLEHVGRLTANRAKRR